MQLMMVRVIAARLSLLLDARASLRQLLLSIIVPLSPVLPRSFADQHLVSSGQEWSRLAGVVRPGDEIVLLPGVHRPATLFGLPGGAGRISPSSTRGWTMSTGRRTPRRFAAGW